MIDAFALALGHGLLVFAMMRLVLRPGLDVDPLLDEIRSETDGNRKAASVLGRNEARRARGEAGPREAGAQGGTAP